MSTNDLTNPIPVRLPKYYWDEVKKLAKLSGMPASTTFRMHIVDWTINKVRKEITKKQKQR